MTARPASPVDEAPPALGDEHLARAARTLRIEPDRWARVLSGYADRSPGPDSAPEARLRALHAAFAEQMADAAPLADEAPSEACPVCPERSVAPRYARGDGVGGPPLFLYG
ncbi:MAG TPA: hypothetical protein VF547_05490, partial [Allosphingosinicella sp.]